MPGDFDEELGRIDPTHVEIVEASRDSRLVVQIALNEDDAAALQRIADDQGERSGEAVRSLILSASAKAA
jgi:hypothetical protein